MSEPLCHCGKPLHYSATPEGQYLKEVIGDLVAEKGECVMVTVVGRHWMVPRHYIALHGVKGADLPSLGFKEVHEPPAGRILLEADGSFGGCQHEWSIDEQGTQRCIGCGEPR